MRVPKERGFSEMLRKQHCGRKTVWPGREVAFSPSPSSSNFQLNSKQELVKLPKGGRGFQSGGLRPDPANLHSPTVGQGQKQKSSLLPQSLHPFK